MKHEEDRLRTLRPTALAQVLRSLQSSDMQSTLHVTGTEGSSHMPRLAVVHSVGLAQHFPEIEFHFSKCFSYQFSLRVYNPFRQRLEHGLPRLAGADIQSLLQKHAGILFVEPPSIPQWSRVLCAPPRPGARAHPN